MYTDVYDLDAEKREFISPIPNRRNVYLEYDFISDKKDLNLIFVETQTVRGRKLTSIKPEERAKIFQTLLDKHKIDAALGDITVSLIVKDNFEKSYGYQWLNSNFTVNEYIKKLDHDECEIIMKQLDR
ncbi:hypothetical protein [Acinetobacter indicus]|uniref:hypothetical protein n=1 Tax=Acinetobacter indicus TaxID=756892 RepID=UPI000CEC1E49|nr:hypothetical protein [Acinetobacter indicus]